MHELDITNGVASFADSRVRADGRVDAWHALGQPVGHLMTAEEVISAAHLGNWNVRKRGLQTIPVITESGVIPPLPVERDYATLRDNPITGEEEVLGVVGRVWQPIQNEETAELLNAIVDQSGAHFETAGALDGGRRTFITMKLPEAISIRGHDGTADKTEMYFAGLNCNDGQNGLRGIVTGTRIVCGNTETIALRNAKASFSIRHTLSAATAISAAREALGLTWKYVEEFEKEVQKMFAQEMSDQQMREFANAVVGLDEADTDRKRTSRTEKASNIFKLWESSPTITNIAGTKWAAYNSVTEYADHFMAVRGGGGSAGSEAQLRAMRTVTTDSSSQILKAKAFDLLTTAR